MEMEQSSSTFWFQPPVATNLRRTPPLNPVFLIILIPVLALLFLLVFLPLFLSYASHIILKPGCSVKSTWDSFNIFLVVFAILCGLMGRKDEDDYVNNSFVAECSDHSVEASAGEWDHKVMLDGVVRQNHRNGYFDVDKQPSDEKLRLLLQSEEKEDDDDEDDVKEIGVDTFVVTPNALQQPLAKTTTPSYNSKRLHSFQSVGKAIVPTNINEADDLKKVISYPPPPPPPPPPEEFRGYRSHHKHKSTLERKVSDATKEIASAISSLMHNHRKRKNKRKSPNTSPPTPPPLPTPPSSFVFQNLFKKGGKHNHNNKRLTHTIPAIVPPPPPSPPNSIFNNIFKSKRFHLPSPTAAASSMNTLFKNGTESNCKLSLPTKTIGYYDWDVVLTSGSQSPLVPVPPPPPFKVDDMKFDVYGDFVKIRSTHSSLCSSPDHDIDMDGEDQTGPASGLICFPSPDVNAKADSFISRLKDEWRMEKMNCVKDKMG